MRWLTILIFIGVSGVFFAPGATAADPGATTPVQSDLIKYLDSVQGELVSVNQDIWSFAELGLQEHRSAARLIGVLRKAGFQVKEGVSGMPTAFVAEYGSGRPIVGILAEYDALPELSQEVMGIRKPVAGRTTGHGCGHCALGTAAVGAALAVKEAYHKHHLKGTIRLYGTPAEETCIGKVYMSLDGQFNDLDACLHWHPGTHNRSYYSVSKAMISAKFTFTGLAAHASASPDKGRSALDGVELMNVGANYMREHIKETSRIHYVITNGGGQPNVVPATAQVWYYVRANTHADVESHFDWLCAIAEGGAKMSRTKVNVQIDTDCHELLPNLPLSRLILENFHKVGPPRFDQADLDLARRLQAALQADMGWKGTTLLEDRIEDLPAVPYADNGSTDVGDVRLACADEWAHVGLFRRRQSGAQLAKRGRRRLAHRPQGLAGRRQSAGPERRRSVAGSPGTSGGEGRFSEADQGSEVHE